MAIALQTAGEQEKKGRKKQKIGIILLTANFVMPYHAGTKKEKNNGKKAVKKKLLKGNGKNKQANRPRTVCSCKSCS